MHSRMLRFFIPVAALALAIPSTAAPCELRASRCVPASALGQSAAEFVRARRDRAERVVLGTVVRLDTLTRASLAHGSDSRGLQPIVAQVQVRRVWRGALDDTMTVMVSTVGPRSSCDLSMSPREAYLIFAARTGGGLLATYQCSGTVEGRAAADVIALLGAGQASRPREP